LAASQAARSGEPVNFCTGFQINGSADNGAVFAWAVWFFLFWHVAI